MKIKNAYFVNNTGIENLANPLLPFNEGVTDAHSYIGLLFNVISKYYKPEISTRITMEIKDGMAEIRLEMFNR